MVKTPAVPTVFIAVNLNPTPDALEVLIPANILFEIFTEEVEDISNNFISLTVVLILVNTIEDADAWLPIVFAVVFPILILDAPDAQRTGDQVVSPSGVAQLKLLKVLP